MYRARTPAPHADPRVLAGVADSGQAPTQVPTPSGNNHNLLYGAGGLAAGALGAGLLGKIINGVENRHHSK